ncbi:MAG: peptidylprolyl isomerase [Vicinamibacteria bacterium]
MSARFAFLPLVFALAGCSQELPRESKVVLEVAGRSVTLGELDRFIRMSVKQESPVLSSEVTVALFDQFVEEQLLLRAADDAGIEADPDVVAQRMKALRSVPEELDREGASASARNRADEDAVAAGLEKQLRIERLVSTEALAGVEVDEAEIASYFESHREDFLRPETVDVSQILVERKDLANDLRKTILSRKSTFEDLAREHSRGPEAGRGGDLGSFTRGELPPSFETEVFALAPGGLSEVVSTDFGYHIFRVNAKTEEKPLSFEEVREAVRVELLREKSDEAMKRYLAGLEKKYPVKVYQQHLSFAVGDGDEEARKEKASENGNARMEKIR